MPYRHALTLRIAYGVQMTRCASTRRSNERTSPMAMKYCSSATPVMMPGKISGLISSASDHRLAAETRFTNQRQRRQDAEHDRAEGRERRDLQADDRGGDELVAAGQIAEPAQRQTARAETRAGAVAEREQTTTIAIGASRNRYAATL